MRCIAHWRLGCPRQRSSPRHANLPSSRGDSGTSAASPHLTEHSADARNSTGNSRVPRLRHATAPHAHYVASYSYGYGKARTRGLRGGRHPLFGNSDHPLVADSFPEAALVHLLVHELLHAVGFPNCAGTSTSARGRCPSASRTGTGCRSPGRRSGRTPPCRGA